MNALFLPYIRELQLTGPLKDDVRIFLQHNGHARTWGHSQAVAEEARHLAERFGVDPEQAESAGLLHDISCVFPNDSRAEAARQLGWEVLPEEEFFPMIAHQKISATMASQIFNVNDPVVLQAVACHTTLRPDASRLDMILFIADKLRWDGPDEPPYLREIVAGLETSLEQGALAYLEYLWQGRDRLPVVHPWMVQARLALIQG
jgi:predicted HD superfamily hydrolase involved in NAD metabolism